MARLAARRLFLFTAWLVVLSASGAASQTLQRVPIRRSSSIEGRALFDTHCAACHGAAGRGDGPAALVFADPIPDLTRIGVREGGYDPVHLKGHLATSPAGARRGMADWPRLLRAAYGQDIAVLVIANLARYIGTVQVLP